MGIDATVTLQDFFNKYWS